MAQLWSLVLAGMTLQQADARPGKPAIDVRVGIVAYQDSRADMDRYREQLSRLASGSEVPLQIRFALGTYGDVVHWMDRKLIDVAVMSPGVFAETLKIGTGSERWRYLGTLGLLPAESPLAGDERRRPGYHFDYRSVCVVSARSSLGGMDDLRRAAEHGGVQFLFVHPLSVSGRIAPEFALRQLGIRPRPEDIEYTYSHSNSLRLVTEPVADKERVAFVWDDPPRLPPDRESLVRKLQFPQLDELPVPQNPVAARTDFEQAELVAGLLARHRDENGEPDVRRFDDWAHRYGVILRWTESLGLADQPPEAQTVSLDELGRILAHYVRSQPRLPRLALVLSGGGAKCAFQVGAVAALEEKLAELRAIEVLSELDIGLVVGTSGGAINALPVALGISASKEGRDDFRRVWLSLDQQEIVRPSHLVRWNMGLWFVALQAAFILWIVRRFVADPARRARRGATLFLLFAVPEIILAHVAWRPWRLFGTNHLLHHAWLWGTFGARWSAWCMFALGLCGFAAQWWLARRGRHLAAPVWLVRSVLVLGLIGLPGLQLVTVLFHENTLTDGAGIEHALAEKLPSLVDGQLARDGQPSLATANAADDAARLRALSRQIIDRGLLRRDLTLTGSCLSKTAGELPSDLYFYAAAKSGDVDRAQPSFGRLGIPLTEHADRVIDVVMGSGSIFPVFPARTLEDFPRPGERVELVDGGFAHNSPIEAAVLWGATHVVLIEASPAVEERRGRRNFLQNSADAFNHLYYQAQLADARSKEKVVIFTLRPQPPHICVLDFADNLIERAIDAGYHEARGDAGDAATRIVGRPNFSKELGEPLFISVNVAAP